MLAVPVLNASEDTKLSPFFGRCKWFALIDDSGAVQFLQNHEQRGKAIATSLVERGVTKILTGHLG